MHERARSRIPPCRDRHEVSRRRRQPKPGWLAGWLAVGGVKFWGVALILAHRHRHRMKEKSTQTKTSCKPCPFKTQYQNQRLSYLCYANILDTTRNLTESWSSQIFFPSPRTESMMSNLSLTFIGKKAYLARSFATHCARAHTTR